MSLLTSASLWTNNDTDSNNKKRTPTIPRKTIKKLPSNADLNEDESQQQPQPVPIQSSSMQDYSTLSSAHNPQPTMTGDLSSMAQRNERVSQLVDKLTMENAGNQLSDFQPLSHPIIQKRTDVAQGRPADELFTPPQNNPLQIPPPKVDPNYPGRSDFIAMDPNLGGNGETSVFGNYKQVYDSAKIQALLQNSGRGGSSESTSLDQKLLEKINYMVHLLEQQHNERTSNITEEFVLYIFLGVFIIFIVDSFARAGRYVR
jgi:hypothetical protein